MCTYTLSEDVPIMPFHLETESENFFGALTPLIPIAVDIAHLCFEQILIKEKRIKGEYDKKKAVKGGIFVSSFKIWDESYGFNLKGVAHSSAPGVEELEDKIDEIQHLLSSLGVYDPNPFPDENLRAHIIIENIHFFSGVFSISLNVRRYRDRKYRGNIYVTYENMVSDLEEASRLIETAIKAIQDISKLLLDMANRIKSLQKNLWQTSDKKGFHVGPIP